MFLRALDTSLQNVYAGCQPLLYIECLVSTIPWLPAALHYPYMLLYWLRALPRRLPANVTIETQKMAYLTTVD